MAVCPIVCLPDSESVGLSVLCLSVCSSVYLSVSGLCLSVICGCIRSSFKDEVSWSLTNSQSNCNVTGVAGVNVEERVLFCKVAMDVV